MNDPKMAANRMQAVERAKREDVEKEDAFSVIQHDWGCGFEGHHLLKTINFVYGETE